VAYAEKVGAYWRGRYRADGKLLVVRDDHGRPARYTGKREAERAARAEEVKARDGGPRKPAARRITFDRYASEWYGRQDLAASTMQNYKRHIEEHLLPAFGGDVVQDITPTDVARWEKEERAAGYKEASIKTWRSTLHLILADAMDEGMRDDNPAARRRGRGKRAGRSRRRGPEKAVTTALGILLIAERVALLSGRDDEFVAVVLQGYTGMRWGEIVGLETTYARSGAIRVEWQLYELDTGELHRCPPKDDSYRTIDTPDFLSALVSGHVAQTGPKPCSCHGLTYAFRGHGSANGAPKRTGAKLADVARRAGVSTGTVSAVLSRPDRVPEARGSGSSWPSASWATSVVVPAGSLRRTGAGAASPPGCCGRRPADGTRRRRPILPDRCRCWPSPGRACRSAVVRPASGPTPAGCPYRRA
jgi:integrase